MEKNNELQTVTNIMKYETQIYIIINIYLKLTLDYFKF